MGQEQPRRFGLDFLRLDQGGKLINLAQLLYVALQPLAQPVPFFSPRDRKGCPSFHAARKGKDLTLTFTYSQS